MKETESVLIEEKQQKSIIKHSTDTEFETPNPFYNTATTQTNIFPTLDICATEENKKCKMYFSKEQDAFNFQWKYDLWANIPFGSKVTKINYKIPEEKRKPLGKGLVAWVQRINQQHLEYDTSALVLLPLSSTIISKFNEFCEVWIIPKRITFWKNGKPDKFPISKDLMLLAFRSKQNIIDTYYSGSDRIQKKLNILQL